MIVQTIDDATRLKRFEDTVGEFLSADAEKWLVENGFFVKPAAINHHGNYTGGLFDHSFEVMTALVEMTKRFEIQWQDIRSPYIVGMFHDLCKIDDYIDENASDVVIMGTGSPISTTPKWTFNNSAILKGHGDKSVMLLSQLMTLTEEEIFCIAFHMGAYETERRGQFDAAIRKYQTVLWTHTADMYASKIKGV